MPTSGGAYTMRPFASLEDYRDCVRMQEAVWGEGFSERVSMAILKVSQRLGGVAAGAYDAQGDLAGFVFGMTGVEAGRLVHWSDMLAVRPGLRDAGLGRQLKAYQRDRMLDLGVTRMYWTFDPLVSRNAHLNLARLGAVGAEYVQDMYGASDSRLHAGIGTDRFVARWDLDAERVRQRLSGAELGVTDVPADAVHLVRPANPGDPLSPPDPTTVPLPSETTRALACAIPADIQTLKTAHPSTATAWREATRSALGEALANGYEARELVRGEAYSTYVLTRAEPTS